MSISNLLKVIKNLGKNLPSSHSLPPTLICFILTDLISFFILRVYRKYKQKLTCGYLMLKHIVDAQKQTSNMILTSSKHVRASAFHIWWVLCTCVDHCLYGNKILNKICLKWIHLFKGLKLISSHRLQSLGHYWLLSTLLMKLWCC